MSQRAVCGVQGGDRTGVDSRALVNVDLSARESPGLSLVRGRVSWGGRFSWCTVVGFFHPGFVVHVWICVD